MKSLVLISVMLMGIAGAAMAAAEEAPMISGGAVGSQDEFLCELGQSAALELPGSIPAPDERAIVRVCGACSQDNCVGKNTGSPCHNQVTGWAWCLNIYANNYCTDGKPMCYCTTEYP